MQTLHQKLQSIIDEIARKQSHQNDMQAQNEAKARAKAKLGI